MPTKSFIAEVVALILLSLVEWHGPSNSHLNCPRDKSSVVRKIVQTKFVPVLNRYRANLPLDCPFAKERDIYGAQESLKEEEGPSHWRCGVCGKAFYSEAYLDKHFDHRHRNLLNTKDDAVCLAKYCDIMRCDALHTKQGVPLLIRDASKESDPPESKETQVTTALRTTLRHLGWSDGCRDTELVQLRTRCQVIIRDCISGLLVNLSMKDFQEIEEDLNKAVCSYLTCEKYWEDSLLEGRHFPLVFLSIMLTILIGGICLCYYIVWIVFDSVEHLGKEDMYEASPNHVPVYAEHLVCVHYNHKCEMRRRMVER